MVTHDVNADTGVAVVTMNKAPVNSMSLEFMAALVDTFEAVRDTNARSVVLTSSMPKVFCAGLEITEMYQFDPDRLRHFWHTLQQVYLTLSTFDRPVIAAINGHAPAGGCLISLTADYRIMSAGRFNIGLNETMLGLPAPPWLSQGMTDVIGMRQADRMLQLGMLVQPDDALRIGLIDEVADDPEDTIVRALREAERWGKVAPLARDTSKRFMRDQLVNKYMTDEARAADVEFYAEFLARDEVQGAIGAYLGSLKQKKN